MSQRHFINSLSNNREEKCGVTKIKICEIMGLIGISSKNKTKKLPKLSLLVQIGG